MHRFILSSWPKSTRTALLLLLCLAMVACAETPPKHYAPNPKDPWQGVNRVTYKFNTAVDKAVLRPVATFYVDYTPKPVQTGVHNFFSNLGEPITIINDGLQAKGHSFLKDTARFLINSTFGLFGLFDVANHVGLPEHKEDFGQTFAVWGIPQGPYLVLPFLGPSTVTDTAGLYTGYSVDPVWKRTDSGTRNKATIVKAIDTRAQFLPLDKTIDKAYDPYSFVRDAYLQHRRFEIYDGNPPPEFPDYPDDGGDSNGDSPPPAQHAAAKSAATGNQNAAANPSGSHRQ